MSETDTIAVWSPKGDFAPISQRMSTLPARAAVNGLLAQLSAAGLAQVLQPAERVALERRQIIQERHSSLRYVYFLERGVASLLAKAGGDRANVEIRTLGIRDFVGLPLLHGVDVSPHRCAVQVAGEALRLRATQFGRLLENVPEFRILLLRYAHEVFVQSSQLVACNTRHSLKQRLARWLLVASDRIDSNRIELTHDGLSRAIAVRRAGVTTEMGRLEQVGLIRRGRGAILILDREGLENVSCSCHRILRGLSVTARQREGMSESALNRAPSVSSGASCRAAVAS